MSPRRTSGQVLLRHDPAAAEVGRLLEDGARVGVAAAHVKNAEPTRGVEGLDHHLAPLLGQKRPQPVRLARHHRRRAEVGELQHRQLLVLLAQAARVIDDQRPAAGALEHQRREVVVEVERRVLAHEDRATAAERDRRLRPEQVVVTGHAPDGDRPGARHGVGVLEREVARLAEPDLVPARLRRQHDGEGGVARDLQARQRVHDEEQLHESIVARNPTARRRDRRCRQGRPPAHPQAQAWCPAPYLALCPALYLSWARGARAHACAAGSRGSNG